MEGELTNALAIATLCCSPPDSSVGLCAILLVRPTLSNTSSALISLSDCFTEAYFNGSATFSRAELLGRSWNFEKQSLFLDFLCLQAALHLNSQHFYH